MKKTNTKLAAIALVLVLAVSALGSSVFAALQNAQPAYYDISNP